MMDVSLYDGFFDHMSPSGVYHASALAWAGPGAHQNWKEMRRWTTRLTRVNSPCFSDGMPALRRDERASAPTSGCTATLRSLTGGCMDPTMPPAAVT
jgi:hypothetical protein